MATTNLLQLCKTALRISTDAFDAEIQLLIDSCKAELLALNVTNLDNDPQIETTIIAYVKWQHGNNTDKKEWEEIYHTKLSQLKTMTGHTDWSVSNG